jgi:hypothetical protein
VATDFDKASRQFQDARRISAFVGGRRGYGFEEVKECSFFRLSGKD